MHIRIEYSLALPRSRSKEQLHQGLLNRNFKSVKQTTTQFKGMTLKEYFRLSESHISGNGQIRETDEEDNCSSKVPTPSFNQYNSRHKMKTEVCENKALSEEKTSFIIKEKPKQVYPFDNRTKQMRLDNITVEIPKRKQQKNGKQFRLQTLGPTRKEQLNRSTITSFYQLEDKKKRMLEKVKHEKERANEMKLSDAFFITKYSQKFKIESKNAY